MTQMYEVSHILFFPVRWWIVAPYSSPQVLMRSMEKNILIISGGAHTTSSVQPHLSIHALGISAFFCNLLASVMPTSPLLSEGEYV